MTVHHKHRETSQTDMMKPESDSYKTSLLTVFSSFSLSVAVTTFEQPKIDTAPQDGSFQTTEQSSNKSEAIASICVQQ
jgi:hypothetical protein